MSSSSAEEEPMDRLDVLSLEMRAGFAELRAGLADVRADLSDFRTQQSDRHATLVDAISDLRNEYRGHTHDS